MFLDKRPDGSRAYIAGKQYAALSIRCDLEPMIRKDLPDQLGRIIAVIVFKNDDCSLFLDYTT
jgi:hypothetical protein